jgi:hypothetical protein
MVRKRRSNVLRKVAKKERQAKVEEYVRIGYIKAAPLARKFGVDPRTIASDIREITQRWADRSEKKSDVMRAHKIEELRAVIEECRRSHKLAKKQIYCCSNCHSYGYMDEDKLKPCPECEGEGEIVKYDGPGNPKWMTEIRKSIVEISRLEGLQTPIKVKHDHEHSGTVGHIKVNGDNLLANADPKDVIQTKLLIERLSKEKQDKIIDVKPIEGD